MCGIVAYLGTTNNSFDIMIEGLKILQNRGYDSAGIVSKNNNEIFYLSKFASTNSNNAICLLEEQKNKHNDQQCKLKIAIAHTRWATHGSKTNANSHPHQTDDIFIVHNGIIENYLEIKLKLINDYIFESETDSEVISCLIHNNFDETISTFNTFKKSISELKGTWAIIMVKENEDAIYISKNGSPLVIGYDENNVFISSEYIAYQKYTTRWLSINDHECLKIFRNIEDNKFYIENQNGIILLDQYIPTRIFICEEQKIEHSPSPFTFWTQKEIFEQSISIWNTLNKGDRIIDDFTVKLGGLDSMENLLLQLDHLVMIGCGTSYHSALFASKLLRDFGNFETIQVFDASEIQSNDIPNKGQTGLIIISQSGETKDCHRAINELKDKISITIGIVNVPGSLISRETDCGIHLNCGKEIGIASTKSFTSQIIALFLLGIWFAQKKNERILLRKRILSQLKILPNLFEFYQDYTKQHVNQILPILLQSEKIFILGRHYSHPIALEGALKIKELTYKNIEGYPGGGLKHGPFALIDNNTIVFIHISENIYKERCISCVQEVKSRGATVIIVTNILLNTDEIVFFYDIQDDIFFSLTSVLLYQYISLQLAIEIGNNPDFPRNLAKVISVD